MGDGASPPFQHIVITRYFVRFSDKPADVAAILSPNHAWLDERFEIFRTVCLPSVAAQSEADFTWLLFFDDATPAAYVEQVRALLAGHPRFKIVMCPAFNNDTRREAVLAELKPETRWLLTTRLDNDDGWHRDFVKSLQNAVRVGVREFLNFPAGIILHEEKTFLYRHASNAFISLSEPAEPFTTVWCAPHVALSKMGPIRQIETFPAFLQLAHQGSMSNKPRGIRVNGLLARPGFEAISAMPQDGGEAEDWAIVAFNATISAAWALRDQAIALARTLLGRE